MALRREPASETFCTGVGVFAQTGLYVQSPYGRCLRRWQLDSRDVLAVAGDPTVRVGDDGVGSRTAIDGVDCAISCLVDRVIARASLDGVGARVDRACAHVYVVSLPSSPSMKSILSFLLREL